MRLKNKELFVLFSINEVSILRKYAILFIISSIIPMALLCYAYFKGTNVGTIAMALMAIGVLFGYLTIRSLLIKAISIAKENRNVIEPFLSPQIVKELNKGENELVVLSSTFAAVTKQLEANVNELRKKNEELETLDKIKDDFINTVSHEFRSPLTIIQESIRQVSEGMFGEVNETQQKYFNMSLRNIDRLKTLIDNMLDIGKIEKGKFEIVKRDIDLTAAIKEVISDFSLKMDKKSLEIKSDLPAAPLQVAADRDKIIQILTNLVSNSYKFTETGWIKIGARDNGRFVECSVEDSGIGIAEKDLPLLFSKFHQLGRNNGQQEKGTGLGLVIAKNIVELHGGQMSVQSKEGAGTTFTFTLPKEGHGP